MNPVNAYDGWRTLDFQIPGPRKTFIHSEKQGKTVPFQCSMVEYLTSGIKEASQTIIGKKSPQNRNPSPMQIANLSLTYLFVFGRVNQLETWDRVAQAVEEAVGEDAVSQGSANPVDVGRTLDFQPPGPCGTLIHGENQRKTVPFALDVANQGSWRTFNFKCLKKIGISISGSEKGVGGLGKRFLGHSNVHNKTRCVFNKRTIKVYNYFSWQCLGTCT